MAHVALGRFRFEVIVVFSMPIFQNSKLWWTIYRAPGSSNTAVVFQIDASRFGGEVQSLAFERRDGREAP